MHRFVCAQTLKRRRPSADEWGEVSLRLAAALRTAFVATAALALSAPTALAQDPASTTTPAAAPTIALVAPVAGGTLGAGVVTQLTATETGDFKVLSIHVDGTPICIFTHVHDSYACPWTPQAADIGGHKITAHVETADGQVAEASAPVTVGRLLPTAVGARVSRHRLHGGAWRLKTTGTIALPAGLTTDACTEGSAVVRVLAHGRVVVDRSVAVDKDCRFSSSVSFDAPHGARRLQVRVAFAGAQLLAPRAAPVQTVRLK
jgi:hypothetical protein